MFAAKYISVKPIQIFMIVIVFALVTSCKKKQLFKTISPESSGIYFNNEIIQTDSINVLDFENVYNGGGVGFGDFNNDGLQDVYLTGNLTSNKLYLNKGNFKFDDITDVAGVSGNGNWSRGISVVDINNDGWMDMYVSASILKNGNERQNLLYINQGLNKSKIPFFREMAAEYNLNDTTHSTMSAFFDFDNDDDLDVYIAVNEIVKGDFPNRFRPRLINGEHQSTGRLYRNDWNDSLHHPVFTDVSRSAGILIEGYSHAVTISDINKDGWKDIYVSNDYLSNNVLYINNGDGTFTDRLEEYFKHSSANAMGNDITDINNDGLVDVIELDMNPEDNYRKKMMTNANSYQTYQNLDYFHMHYQYVRNSVHLNQGPRVNQKDSIGFPVFSDIAFFAGLAETDWSWAPLVVDFNNDGFRDIIVTNGFPKDVTDHDFIAFRNASYTIASKKHLLNQIPEVKIHNYGFINNGNATFTNVTSDWGLTTPSFSSGGAYADLDNDGDLDIVINNINDAATIYKNTIDEIDGKDHHYLQFQLEGSPQNRNGLGVWIELYYKGKLQVYEQNPYRGYLSSNQINPHFGVGDVAMVDSVIIKWPQNKKQVLRNISTNQVLKINYKDAKEYYEWRLPLLANPFFTEITDSLGFNYVHKETDFIDFNIQKLLPHKFSEFGPALAVGDLDGNGTDDLIAGGSLGNSATMFFQNPDGQFSSKELLPGATFDSKKWEDMGILLFDADNDTDLDIFIASGGYENPGNTSFYKDRFYVNDSRGNFSQDSLAIPLNFTSKSCVRAADYDRDGDMDLFIAGRVDPWNYPKPVSSNIYRNDSKKGFIKFTDVTSKVAPAFQDVGLVSDAMWTDFDNDGWMDIVLAGEWMPLMFIKNDKGIFRDITPSTGIQNYKGWWRSIVAGDFDNDGDMDYIAGNLGLNSFYRADQEHPVRIYAKDFDHNGSYDAIPSIYLPATLDDPVRKEFPVHTRDDMIKQMISFRAKFQNYKSYAPATLDQLFTKEELKDALILTANTFSHCLFKNNGNNRFEKIPLPFQTQYSCINGMITGDFNNDSNLDILLNGNDYGTEVSIGRYDACNGLFLAGDGKGGFIPSTILESGIFIPGDGKALVKMLNNKGNCLIAASQNRGPLKVYISNNDQKIIPVKPMDAFAQIKLKNGSVRREEIKYGESFLSQSGRFFNVPRDAVSIEVTGFDGKKRNLVWH